VALDRREPGWVELEAQLGQPTEDGGIVFGRKARERVDVRRKRFSPAVQVRLLSVRPAFRPGEPLPASSFIAPRGVASVFRDSSGSRSGFPKTPRESRYPRVASVRMPDVTRARKWCQRGYPRTTLIGLDWWKSHPRDGRSGRSTRRSDGPAKRSPNDVNDLVDVLLGLAALGGRTDTTLHMILQQEDRQRIDRGANGGRLLEDVHAVLLALDHSGNAPNLAFHPRQAPDQGRFVFGVAVPEVVWFGWRRRARQRGARRQWARSRGGRLRRGSCAVIVHVPDDTPWGYLRQARFRGRFWGSHARPGLARRMCARPSHPG
jgi:hypothetical protein